MVTVWVSRWTENSRPKIEKPLMLPTICGTAVETIVVSIAASAIVSTRPRRTGAGPPCSLLLRCDTVPGTAPGEGGRRGPAAPRQAGDRDRRQPRHRAGGGPPAGRGGGGGGGWRGG